MKQVLVLFLALVLAALGAFFGVQHPAPPAAEAIAPPAAQEAPALQKGAFIITEKRRQHILAGDETGGGHRAGAGRKGKTEFPMGWSDEKIIATALAIANDEQVPMRPSGRYWLKMKDVDGIKIRVVLNRETQEIITAYPLTPKGAAW